MQSGGRCWPTCRLTPSEHLMPSKLIPITTWSAERFDPRHQRRCCADGAGRGKFPEQFGSAGNGGSLRIRVSTASPASNDLMDFIYDDRSDRLPGLTLSSNSSSAAPVMTIVSGQFGASPSITHSTFPAPPTANRWNSLVMNFEHWLIRLMAGSDKRAIPLS